MSWIFSPWGEDDSRLADAPLEVRQKIDSLRAGGDAPWAAYYVEGVLWLSAYQWANEWERATVMRLPELAAPQASA